jgi:hypothetical protein
MQQYSSSAAAELRFLPGRQPPRRAGSGRARQPCRPRPESPACPGPAMAARQGLVRVGPGPGPGRDVCSGRPCTGCTHRLPHWPPPATAFRCLQRPCGLSPQSGSGSAGGGAVARAAAAAGWSLALLHASRCRWTARAADPVEGWGGARPRLLPPKEEGPEQDSQQQGLGLRLGLRTRRCGFGGADLGGCCWCARGGGGGLSGAGGVSIGMGDDPHYVVCVPVLVFRNCVGLVAEPKVIDDKL